MSAEQVAWAFVRDRVVDHSPSFEWDAADLERLIAIVAGVCEPELDAVTPDQLVPELQRRRAEDEQKLLQVSSALQEKIEDLSSGWGALLAESIIAGKTLGITGGAVNQLLSERGAGANLDLTKTYRATQEAAAASKAVREVLRQMDSNRVGAATQAAALAAQADRFDTIFNQYHTTPLVASQMTEQVLKNVESKRVLSAALGIWGAKGREALDKSAQTMTSLKAAESFNAQMVDLAGRRAAAIPNLAGLAAATVDLEQVRKHLFANDAVASFLANGLIQDAARRLPVSDFSRAALEAAELARASEQPHAADALEDAAQFLEAEDTLSARELQEALQRLLQEAARETDKPSPLNPWVVMLIGWIVMKLLDVLVAQLGLLPPTGP